MTGIRTEWEADALLDFGPRYKTADEAREGVRSWSAVCQNAMKAIDLAQECGLHSFVHSETVRLAGYRAELESARKRLAELTTKTIEGEVT
jgi:hypothetical protein